MCDIPSLCGRSFRQDFMSVTFSSIMSFGAFVYGSDTQQYLTHSLGVLIAHLTRFMCCNAAHMLMCVLILLSIFWNSLSLCTVTISKPLFLYRSMTFLMPAMITFGPLL